MKVAFFSHTAAVDTFRVGSHFLARELSRAGHDVIHISTPVSPLHRILNRKNLNLEWLREHPGGSYIDKDRVRHVGLFLPAPLGSGPRTVRSAMATCTIREIARKTAGWLDETVICIADQPLFVDVIERLAPRIVVYRPTDVQSIARVRAAELRMSTVANAVVTTNPVVFQGLPEELKLFPHLSLSNGVDFDVFSCDVPLTDRRTRAIYIGAFDERFDWEAVNLLAERFGEITIDLYGPAPASPPPLNTNVTLHGPVPHTATAELMADATVGLLPFTRSARSLGRAPMKLYEYLAAGLNVVASETPTLRTASLPGVMTYADPSTCISAFARASQLSLNVEGRNISREMDWSKRAAELWKFIDDVCE